jgi:mono/diheme cytochrome c family protein
MYRLGSIIMRLFLAISVASFLSLPVAAESLLKRGSYLVNGIAGCGNCHTPKGGPLQGREMAGGFAFGGPKAPFEAYASNLTMDRETGIGAWTDDQIVVALRQGKRPDGSIIGPPMPTELYKNISDRDAKAIVVYLRTVKPVRNKVKKSVYRIPLHAEKPLGVVADVPRSDPVRYGRYLAGPMGHCIECHTPMVRGRFDYSNQLGRGGRPFRGPWGVSVARNITPHPEDGLGSWTNAQIKKAITDGVRPDGARLNPPMAYHLYKTITNNDLDAIVVYLRTLKPLPTR